MFFPQNKTVFVHIPKTGGTSIEHQISLKYLNIDKKNKNLFMHENHTIRGKFNKFEFNTPKGHRHSFICEYNEFLSLDEYQSFAILREPTSQVYSLYKQIKDNHRDKKILHLAPSLNDFIFGGCKHDLKYYDYYINQYKYTHINDELKVNHIFLYEKYHLVQDFVEKLYNIKIDRNLTLMKTTEDEQVLTKDMKDEIKKHYPETFDLYNRFSKYKD
jgi:hypothetical protein